LVKSLYKDKDFISVLPLSFPSGAVESGSGDDLQNGFDGEETDDDDILLRSLVEEEEKVEEEPTEIQTKDKERFFF
jgi:hypothetical protein